MRIKMLNSILRILGVLMIVSIIPSCVFASEHNSPDQAADLRLGPLGNVSSENFASVQSSILDSISKQITELQSFYTNVSEASNATELMEVLANHRPANECMGPDDMRKGPGEMRMGPGQMNGFNLNGVANVTDDNFTEVQADMVGSLGNMTDMLKTQLNDTRVSQDSNRTAEINSRISEIQNLSTQVSGASTASELKEVVFKYMQALAVDSIDNEVERLKKIENENGNDGGNTTELSSRITELTALKEKINGAGSLEDLKTIMSSSQGTFGMRDGMMHHGGHDMCRCQMDDPGRMSSTDNSTENANADTSDETANEAS